MFADIPWILIATTGVVILFILIACIAAMVGEAHRMNEETEAQRLRIAALDAAAAARKIKLHD